jgi:hypothetical protein
MTIYEFLDMSGSAYQPMADRSDARDWSATQLNTSDTLILSELELITESENGNTMNGISQLTREAILFRHRQ